MTRVAIHVRTLAALLGVAVASGACAQPAPPTGTAETPHAIAVTIDDLPAQRAGDLGAMQRVTRDLLSRITEAGLPVTGFVNEGKLDVEGEREARADLLRQWVDAGLDLGNHTVDHVSLFTTPLAAFEDQVRRGAVVTNWLLAARGDSARYFRHPYLNVGPDIETKRAFETWLAAEGYTVAPVTHDNGEYIYAFAYDRAAGDAALQARIADAYLAYMDTTAAYFEDLSQDLFGRDVAHVLLIHANALNADHLDRLLDTFRQRGYRFVSLDEALADPAYQSEDTYTGRAGMSWLQHWAITRGVRFESEPVWDDWVYRIAYPDE